IVRMIEGIPRSRVPRGRVYRSERRGQHGASDARVGRARAGTGAEVVPQLVVVDLVFENPEFPTLQIDEKVVVAEVLDVAEEMIVVGAGPEVDVADHARTEVPVLVELRRIGRIVLSTAQTDAYLARPGEPLPLGER